MHLNSAKYSNSSHMESGVLCIMNSLVGILLKEVTLLLKPRVVTFQFVAPGERCWRPDRNIQYWCRMSHSYVHLTFRDHTRTKVKEKCLEREKNERVSRQQMMHLRIHWLFGNELVHVPN